ncbi:ribbon-helix-helix protein, CopG family [Rhodococcus aetherivorans]|uniref:ribbon-helix-helix protein, CopG family n=1 Tax=Rhodococcus aetherivorans TaxID=191292 RepID=UPI003CD03BB0
MSTSRGTTRRTVRVDGELWEAASAKATADGISVSDVIRDALREYVSEHDRPE